MLHFVVGIAGTGKSRRLIDKICEGAKKKERQIYLVPEQYSFEAERGLYRALGPRLTTAVEVLSFTRLCNSVFREYGGLAGTPLTKAAKYLLMSLAVEELRESLSIYNKSCRDAAFLSTLLETCGEFKTAGIQCGDLQKYAKRCEDEPLGAKLHEISLIYAAYQGMIERGYQDPDDDLIRASALLENNTFFEGKTVFVDGFATFMAAEFELLGHVISQAKDVFFAMTADEVFDSQRGMGVFSPSKAAISRLSRLAEHSGVAVAPPEILSEPLRYKKPELSFVAKHFMQTAPPQYSGDFTDALQISVASDAYRELNDVASQIARLVREKNCRYNDIAVIARDPEPYARAIELTFSRHSIPYFMSVSEDIEQKPLISCVHAALNAVRGGFGAEDVLLFAKSPLLGLEVEDVAALENYCYCWNTRAALWHSDFTDNPRGLAGPMTERDAVLLERVNITRAAVIEPLLRLQNALKRPDGQSFAKAVFELLLQIGAAEHLTAYAATLAQKDAFLDEAALLWDEMVSILDIFGSVLGGNSKFSAARLSELFKLAVNAAEVTSLPQTLDQVLVGAADRIRPESVKAVFLIGANENIFPAQASSTGVFSDMERRVMVDAGLEIAAPLLQKSVLEKYFAYFSAALPSEWLFVSCLRSDLKGAECLPSAIVTQLKEIFPALPPPQADELSGASTAESAFDVLSQNLKMQTPLAATLHAYFADNGREKTLVRMRNAADRPPFKIADGQVARELFGSIIRLSPSRVERYYKCPFSYFASDGLRLKPRNKAEFSGLEAGNVIHHVLQAILQKYGGKGLLALTNEDLNAEIANIIRELLANSVEDIEKLPARLRFLFDRLSGMLSRILRRLGEEFAQSEFAPAAFELPIRMGGEVEPLRLETPDGITVVVEGIVDRVDVMNKGGRRYIRVIDYKSGQKEFALHDVLYGLNMQMLLYMFTISENGRGDLSGAIPAGVLYMPARERFVTAARDESDESIAKTREKSWRMNGLLLDDEEALRGMEHDIAGIYIPAKLDKSGNLDAASSIASRAELGALARKIKAQVAQMANLLGKGAIEACPVDENGNTPCIYCDYRAVCGYEPGDAVRTVAKLDRQEFFKMLEETENGGIGEGVDQTAK